MTPLWRSLAAAVVGNVLEWFDWTVYAALAVFFSAQIFPAGSSIGAVLDALLVFAAGFLVRPLGGVLFGALADRRGRRTALTVSVVLMGGGSLLVALCPTYAAAGFLAPVLLVVARLAQGLSLGGEFGVSSVFLTETAPAHRRGLFASAYYSGTAAGLLLASGVTTALLAGLGRTGVENGGWRIAFALGALGALAGYLIRRGTQEPDTFQRLAHDTAAGPRRGSRTRLLTWAHAHGLDLAFFGYVAAAAVLAAVVFAVMPETHARPLDPAEPFRQPEEVATR